MSDSRKKKRLEARLEGRQKHAAYLLVENEFLPQSERRTQEEIAQEIGVSRQTLHTWRTKNRDFIDYKNIIADDFLAEKRSEVYSQLMKLIESPQPSVKAIDLFLRRHGLLTDRQVTEIENVSDERSTDDLKKELEDLDDLLNED